MPEYTWVCEAGHVTRKFRSIAKFSETVRCATTGCLKKAKWFLEKPAGFNSPGDRIWLGSEVVGKKKAQSDEYRSDLEAAAVKSDGITRDVQEAYEKTRAGVNR